MGVEAIQLGLVDELGNKDTAINEIKNKLNVSKVRVIEFKEEKSLLASLTKLSSYYIGEGIGALLANKATEAKTQKALMSKEFP